MDIVASTRFTIVTVEARNYHLISNLAFLDPEHSLKLSSACIFVSRSCHQVDCDLAPPQGFANTDFVAEKC